MDSLVAILACKLLCTYMIYKHQSRMHFHWRATNHRWYVTKTLAYPMKDFERLSGTSEEVIKYKWSLQHSTDLANLRNRTGWSQKISNGANKNLNLLCMIWMGKMNISTRWGGCSGSTRCTGCTKVYRCIVSICF